MQRLMEDIHTRRHPSILPVFCRSSKRARPLGLLLLLGFGILDPLQQTLVLLWHQRLGGRQRKTEHGQQTRSGCLLVFRVWGFVGVDRESSMDPSLVEEF